MATLARIAAAIASVASRRIMPADAFLNPSKTL